MKKLISVLLLCLFTVNVFCAVKKEHDGKWWNSLKKETKLHYIIGYDDAYVFHARRELYMLRIELDEDKTPKYTCNEIMNLVDNIYSKPKYRILRIETVIEFVVYPTLRNGWNKEEMNNKALEILKQTQETE